MRQTIVLALLAVVMAHSPAEAARTELRWLLLQDRNGAVENTALEFAEKIQAETRGAIHVSIVSRTDFSSKVNGGRSPGMNRMIVEVANGGFEMCEAPTTALGSISNSLMVLTLPYLFRGYDEAIPVLHGAIGQSIANMLLKRRGRLRGLALAIDGFGIFATRGVQPVDPKDFKGLRLQVAGNAASQGIVKKIGAEPVTVPAEGFSLLAENGFSDGLETTFLQFRELNLAKSANAILDTRHDVHVNMIVVNESFFQLLPEEQQAALRRVAFQCARSESERTSQANDQARRELEKEGVRVTIPSEDASRQFREILANVVGDVGVFIGIDGQDQIEAIRGAVAQRRNESP